MPKMSEVAELKRIVAKLQGRIQTTGTAPVAATVTKDPVSYTHLDVYKRQIIPTVVLLSLYLFITHLSAILRSLNL